jgi:hypothetical protein
MRTNFNVKVLPEYGWGWFAEPGNHAVNVPDPFTVEIESVTRSQDAFENLSGLVTGSSAHQFAGFRVALCRRTPIGYEGRYNVLLTNRSPSQPASVPPEGKTVTGFAKLGTPGDVLDGT